MTKERLTAAMELVLWISAYARDTGTLADRRAFAQATSLSLRCESNQDEQSASTIQIVCLGVRWNRSRGRRISAALAATQRCADLPCLGRTQVIIFYFRLSPCQPRATLKIQNKRRAFRPAVYCGKDLIKGSHRILRSAGHDRPASEHPANGRHRPIAQPIPPPQGAA